MSKDIKGTMLEVEKYEFPIHTPYLGGNVFDVNRVNRRRSVEALANVSVAGSVLGIHSN